MNYLKILQKGHHLTDLVPTSILHATIYAVSATPLLCLVD
jgi:hypothetical protein